MEDGFDPSQADLKLHIEGFEGPLYFLLDLARRQRGDLAEISILLLVDQYIAAISELSRAMTLKPLIGW